MGAYLAGAPPGLENDEAQAGQDLSFGVPQTIGLGLQNDNSTSTARMRSYEQRRRARRKRLGRQWRQGGDQ